MFCEFASCRKSENCLKIILRSSVTLGPGVLVTITYFVCAIGGQHDGHLPWLPGFVKLIMLLLHVLFAVAEIKLIYYYYSDVLINEEVNEIVC